MTVHELAVSLSLTVFSGNEEALATEVNGGYCGDLLSWVMGRAPAGGVWLTIMSNVNVAAVATLGEISCVILCEGVLPDAGLLERMEQGDIALLGSNSNAFDLSGQISLLL